ncbi:MAG: P-loop NTPase [Thermotogae bacterium]|nr:P-loop NTPase [Thermotogota bacterium]
MRETNFQYTYRRIKAVLVREWRLILLTAILGAAISVVGNILLRKGPKFRAYVHMMKTSKVNQVSVLADQMGSVRPTSPSVDVLALKIRFPDFYRGLKDTALMYEVLKGRVAGIREVRPGKYSEKNPGVVKCPCSKSFLVVVYDTLSLWKRLAEGRIRVLEDKDENMAFGPKNTVFFTVEYISPDRRWAKRAAERVAYWIIQKHLEEKKQSLLRQKRTIEKLMDFYKREINTFANQIQRFKERMKYPEFTEEKIVAILSDLKAKERALNELMDILRNSPEDTIFVDVGDPLLNDLQQSRINLLMEIWNLETTYGRSHPKVKALYNSLRKMNTLILGSAAKNRDYVRKQISYYKRILPEVLKEQATLLTIQRNLENAEDFYIVLGQKLNDTDVQLGSLVPDITILGSPTVRRVGIYSRSRVAAILGLLLGLIIGVAMAFFKDLTTDVILDESTLPFPEDKIILMPTFSSFDSLPADMVRTGTVDSTSPALNEFRKLLFELNMFGDLKEIVAVTSTQTGEGKTFISANLAAAAALSGIPVLLIDGDIRAKGLSEMFGLGDSEGYSNGRFEPYPIHPNLYILPVGTADRDHLVVFKEMLDGIKDLLERFRVVLDLPPFPVSPEIKLLDRFAVKYLLVLKYNYTKRSMLKRITINPELVIFNQVGRASEYYSRYYNRYGRRTTLWDRIVGPLKRLFKRHR